MQHIHIQTYSELSKDQLFAIMQLRQQVFIVEQVCAYQDLDDWDKQSMHVSIWLDGKLAAYARVVPPKLHPSKCPAIGRVVVADKYRGQQLGHEVMKVALACVEDHFAGQTVTLSAQYHLKKFYADLGFVPQGMPYPEDGIPHIKMIREAQA